METNDIKNIWKEGIEENIKPYSNSKLNKIVIKSAQSSMKAIYSGTFRLIIIGVAILIIVILVWGNRSKEVMLVDFCALIIVSVSYFFWERSAYKMQKYSYGIPVKEWLEYRIREVEKSVNFYTKYDLLIYGFSFLCAIGFYILYQVVGKITPSLLTLFIIPIGLVIYFLIIRRFLSRNYKKTLDELKELYTQFEESENERLFERVGRVGGNKRICSKDLL
ncbi:MULTISPECIES: hypothetical protein [Proteiniphilum]|jgi:predicted neutral ceramidase superfamily lipid hydrolase|uniref:hypothetical protein n=1 Tax=Proteiniphilum TaxID=294702 RepID=UPI0027000D71|nr:MULTISPECIES: hypothetical protein [Proteiniphilum]MDO4556577.1 hypothetical protein [Lachnospiraceae bacterium]MDY9917474.1 hypothetical protein [Proteiniphilum sp.]